MTQVFLQLKTNLILLAWLADSYHLEPIALGFYYLVLMNSRYCKFVFSADFVFVRYQFQLALSSYVLLTFKTLSLTQV